MIEYVVLFGLAALLVFALASGRSVPTPIPQHLADRAREFAAVSTSLTVWRIVLIVAFFAVGGYTVLINPTGLIAFFAAGLLLWVFMDDLQQTLIDVWNADFWRVDP